MAEKRATIQHGGDRKTDQSANVHLATAAKTMHVSRRSIEYVRAIRKVAPEKIATLNQGTRTDKQPSASLPEVLNNEASFKEIAYSNSSSNTGSAKLLLPSSPACPMNISSVRGFQVLPLSSE